MTCVTFIHLQNNVGTNVVSNEQLAELNSKIFKFPELPLKGAKRLVLYMRTFGGHSAKPLEFMCDWQGAGHLRDIHQSMWDATATRATTEKASALYGQPEFRIKYSDPQGGHQLWLNGMKSPLEVGL